MPVSPQDFQDHANRVKSEFSDEMARRAIISRHYYYIFHRMREENAAHPQSRFNRGGSDHQEASKFLERLGYKNLADEFDDLRHKRNKADYDIQKSIGAFEFQMSLADLNDFEREAEQENILS